MQETVLSTSRPMNRRPATIRAAMTLILILASFPFILIGSAHAQQAGPPRGPTEAGLLDPGALPHLAPPEGAAPAWNAPAGTTDWSKLAFYSYRDGNPEIYVANGNGSGQTRITFDAAADWVPSINRGCTRIAFVSRRTGNPDIFTANLDGSALARLTYGDASDTYPAWSPNGMKIAFHSYRDGQAEIYVMNADGSGQTRLTYDPAYDGEPAWSPDGTKIAFTSGRSGGDYIWVMNADGTGLRQLSTKSESENAVWSPDGTYLAFDSAYNNGNHFHSLWLINADGSNERMIYWPTEQYTETLARSFSPDGRYLAFTRVSYTIYNLQWYWTTAYLDAWDTQTSAVSRLSGQGEDWFPTWQTCDAAPPSTTVLALPVTSPARFGVRWTGYDNGPAGLAGYDVQVKDGTGPWSNYLAHTTATSSQYVGRGGHTYYFRSRGWDNAFNVSAWPAGYQAKTTVESLPPDTRVIALPPYSRNNSTIAWGGNDPGESGIDTYDVQYRDVTAGGGWVDWVTATKLTSASFQNVQNHTYRFRSRATDLAGNLEAWPAGDGDTGTTFYAWAITGTVRDNLGMPLSGVNASTTPPALGVIPSDAGGRYGIYLPAGAMDSQAIWVKSGYGSLPPVTFAGGRDGAYDPFLPPPSSAVRDGNFETGSLASEWTASGTIAPAVAGVAHSGSYAALLGAVQPAPLNLGVGTGYCEEGPQIASGADGRVHLVWASRGNPIGLMYAARAAGGDWSTPVPIPGSASGYLPKTAVDALGAVHVLWRRTNGTLYDLMYSRHAPNGVWSTPYAIETAVPLDQYRPAYAIVADADGAAHIAWGHNGSGSTGIFYVRRDVNGSWTAPQTISSPSYWTVDIQLAMDASGRLHALWRNGVDPSFSQELRYAQKPVSGNWSAPEQAAPVASEIQTPMLAVDGSGGVHIAWRPAFVFSYRYRSPAGVWSLPQAVGASYSEPAALIADAAGNAHLLWYEDGALRYSMRSTAGAWSTMIVSTDVTGGLSLALDETGALHALLTKNYEVYHTKMHNGAWEAPRQISGSPGSNSAYPAMVVQPGGAYHVTWAECSGASPGIYYVGAGAIPDGNSAVSQAIAVPAASSNPVLSFLYRVQGDVQETGSGLSARISNGIETETVFSCTTPTADWAHRWFDLAAWAGQAVTLTFEFHQGAGDYRAWSYVDEVSIGTGFGDVYVNQVMDRDAGLPGQDVVFRVAYGNRSPAPTAGVRITDVLPAGLTFKSASITPIATAPDLVWDLGSLAGTANPPPLVITATIDGSVPTMQTVTNTVRIGTSSPEVETANNEASASVYIGVRLRLPMVAR